MNFRKPWVKTLIRQYGQMQLTAQQERADGNEGGQEDANQIAMDSMEQLERWLDIAFPVLDAAVKMVERGVSTSTMAALEMAVDQYKKGGTNVRGD